MKILKLAFISLVAFVLLVWGITLLFPSNTVISRVTNVAGKADSLKQLIVANRVSMQKVLAGNKEALDIRTADIPFYENNLFNQLSGDAVPKADTIFFGVLLKNKIVAKGGMALYQLSNDSATVQMFYVFQTPWYNPLQKMRMMMADKAMGPSLDSSLNRFKSLATLAGLPD